MRLSIIAIAPAPYRDPLFRRLAGLSGVELRVFYLQGKDSVRGWNAGLFDYPAEFVSCLTPERLYPLPLLGSVNPSIVRRLASFQPSVLVVYGHSYHSQYQAMRWASGRQVPYLLRCDRNPDSIIFRRDGGAVRGRRFKEHIIRYFTTRAAGALTIGTATIATGNTTVCRPSAVSWRRLRLTTRSFVPRPRRTAPCAGKSDAVWISPRAGF